jgi:pimeloyl-ACP methyl ester carboxylesterase
MGGKTAMTLLQEFPLGLGKVIVVDIAPVRYFHDHDAYIHAMQSTAFDGIESRRQVEEHLSESVPEPAVRQFLMQNLEREGDKFRWRINLDAIANNMPDIMGFGDYGTAQAQIVFIAGENSNYILPDHQDAIRTKFPNAIIETIPGVGHWLHAEKPQAFTAIVNKHLER